MTVRQPVHKGQLLQNPLCNSLPDLPALRRKAFNLLISPEFASPTKLERHRLVCRGWLSGRLAVERLEARQVFVMFGDRKE